LNAVESLITPEKNTEPDAPNLFELYGSVSKGQAALLGTLQDIFTSETTTIIEKVHAKHNNNIVDSTDPALFTVQGRHAQLRFLTTAMTDVLLSLQFRSAEHCLERIHHPQVIKLVNHIRQALNMSYTISQQESDLDSIQYVIDHYPAPTLAIDNHLNTIFCNTPAKQTLYTALKGSDSAPSEDQQALSLSELKAIGRDHFNFLTLCSNEHQQHALKQALIKHLKKQSNKSQYLNILIGKKSIPIVLVSPLSVPNIFRNVSRNNIVWVYLLNTDFSQALKRHSNFQALNLSTAEAELSILLFEGKSLIEISESRKVSKQTVRKQLQAVLRKTQCENQEGLILFLFDQCIRHTLIQS
jgi:DNA-binding CsgD family transcriptional regulator